MKTNIYKKIKVSLLLTVLVLVSSFIVNSIDRVDAQSTAVSLSGYAWSSTIGWIDVSDVSVDSASGIFSGYGWSSNVGWVSFNAADVSGCPGGTCTPTVSVADGKISGFIRACAGTVGGNCQGASRTDGWDGWIELSGLRHPSPQTDGSGGVTYNDISEKLMGYAWGSDVVGWVDFSGVGVSLNSQCLNGATNPPSCTICANGATMIAGKCVPGDVTGLSANTSPICGGKVNVSWDPSQADFYRVYRSTSSTGLYSLIASPSVLTFSDTANPSTTYWYKVSAVKNNIESDQGSAVSALSSAICTNNTSTSTSSTTTTTTTTTTSTSTITVGGSLPQINSFKMTPGLVKAGDSCTMTWATQNTASCVITGPGFGTARSVSASGNLVTPPVNAKSVYTLTCRSTGGGTASKNALCSLLPSVIEN